MCFKLKTRTINPDKLCRGMDVEHEQFQILDPPYYVFVALCIVVIVVSLILKMAYFLS